MVKSGLAELQEGLTWRNIMGVGLLGGIGFTMSMFISNLAFDDANLVGASKLSILISSALAAISGLIVFITSRQPDNKNS
jgi:NhaA family Na+:H+ antiporter